MRIGSLCSGYGGLDMAVAEFFNAEVAWFFEYDKAPSKILAHHWPDVPNYGDMTNGDWAGIEQVDIICGGTPCQDLSGAGKRAGMTEGTRSNLWVAMREAVAVQRPRYVVWENVRGAYSAGASSEVESEPGLLGGTPGGYLRALGRVVGDLASLGYVGWFVPVRASDAGAPHGRYRVFVVAELADPSSGRSGIQHDRAGSDAARRSGVRVVDGSGRLSPSENSNVATGDQWWQSTPGQEESGRSRADTGGRGGTPVADSGSVGFQEGRLPSRRSEEIAGDHDRFSSFPWGVYESAIRRCEQLTRPAPNPVNERGRLSAPFVEWMMMLPDGHVTDPAIGLTRNEQLKALGNGVVPAQALLALRQIWSMK